MTQFKSTKKNCKIYFMTKDRNSTHLGVIDDHMQRDRQTDRQTEKQIWGLLN